MKQPTVGLPVFETLYALNRDFEQVLADLARLQELGGYQQTDLELLIVIIQETRAWANLDLVQVLQVQEPDERPQFGGLLIEAAHLLKKRKEAGKKKGQRKRPRAGSEGV